MTVLATGRQGSREKWYFKEFPLASGNKAYANGIACFDLSTGKCEPGHIESDLLLIGFFAEEVDATAAEKQVNVRLAKPIEVEWLANAPGGDAVLAAHVGSICYVFDDQTVTITPTGASVAGRVWAVSSTDGVAVERLDSSPAALLSLSGLLGVSANAPAFAANDSVVANNPTSGTMFTLLATAGASTVTLPNTAVDGTVLFFHADGVVNGHTVTYRQGATSLTAALTASKRHVATAVFRGSTWAVTANAAP